jgi:hypothetical protein
LVILSPALSEGEGAKAGLIYNGVILLSSPICGGVIVFNYKTVLDSFFAPFHCAKKSTTIGVFINYVQ